ncbi:MAG: hypothetical protein IJW82_07870 [Clostridia bacterium]|nr:hypothetical protein [Clostridia bacterium]
MDEKLKNELYLTDYEIEMLNNRAEFFGRLGDIQSKYGLPAFTILQYFAKKMRINQQKEIPFDVEAKLVENCQKGNKIIIKNIKEVCRICNLDEDEQEGFYRLILDNNNLCEYFLSNTSKDIIDTINQFNCEGFDKMMTLIKSVDPHFDYNEYNKINNK